MEERVNAFLETLRMLEFQNFASLWGVLQASFEYLGSSSSFIISTIPNHVFLSF